MTTVYRFRTVWEADHRYQDCERTGRHPVDSGERTEALLGGEPVTMARCRLCGMRYPAPVRQTAHELPTKEFAQVTTCPAPDAIPTGRAYYVSLRRNDHDTRTVMLAGPYYSHGAAHAALPAVHKAAEAIDAYAYAYVWGCAVADRGISTRLGIVTTADRSAS